MSDSSKPASDPFSAFAKFTPPSAQALQGSIQELMQETQKAGATWMRHRQEATDAAMHSLQSIWGCKEPGALASACSDWVTKNIELAASEMREAQEETFRCMEIGQRFIRTAFQSGSASAEATPPKAASQSAKARSAAE